MTRVRIAPSPTGKLHLGTARTALYNYLFAHHHQGKFILRLEDTDEQRSCDSFSQDIFAGLHWLGLNWDEGPDIGGPFGPYKQTEKIDHYDRLANQLISKKLAYFCYCSIEQLTALKDQQKDARLAARYDNRCRHLSSEKIEQFEKQGIVPSIRFRIEEPRMVSWVDQVKGEVTVSSSDLGGDMVIIKSNGTATYNFAVVIDDLDMKITHVIRGEDHLHNTAKQLLLYEALGQSPPQFAHVALMFDTEHRKLSKRQHGEAVHIERYKQDGYMPEALVNYLAQMSWTPANGAEIFSLDEAAKLFDISRVSKSPAVFDIQKLIWFNGHYLRNLPISVITDRAMPYLSDLPINNYSRAELEQIVDSVRGGLSALSEIRQTTAFYFDDLPVLSPECSNLLSNETSHRVLSSFLKEISTLPWGNCAGCKSMVDQLGKNIGLKGKDLYWPIRAALSGSLQGPELGSIISILNETRVHHRIEAALKLCCNR